MDELRFDGQVAIVTGAGRGIGKAEAVFLAERGAAVVVNDLGGSTSGEGEQLGPAEEVVAEIVDAGGKAVASGASIATEEGAQSIIDLAISEFGRVDALVNNAGIMDDGQFPDVSLVDLNRQLGVHLTGYFLCTRAAWPHMVKQGGGRVIMTISSAGLYGMPTQLCYGSAKGGIVGLTHCLATFSEDQGIKVNALAPAAYSRMAANIKDETYKEFSKATRTTDSVTPIVALLSHESCPTNGEIYTAASGRVARVFVAETRGYFNLHHSPEDLVENWDEVNAEEGYSLPHSAGDNVMLALERLREEGIDVPESLGLGEFSRPGK